MRTDERPEEFGALLRRPPVPVVLVRPDVLSVSAVLDSTMASSKRPLSPKNVADVIVSVMRMSFQQKELLIEEIFQAQTNVLGFAVAGVRLAPCSRVQDMLMDITMVAFRAMQSDLESYGEITQAEVEALAEQNMRMWKFLDDEPDETFTECVKATMENYPEPCLLAFTIDRMVGLEVDDPHVILAAKTVVDACVNAKWPGLTKTSPEQPSPTKPASK